MINFLSNCRVEKYTNAQKLHVLTVKNENNKRLDIIWVEDEGSVELKDAKKVFDIYGNELKKFATFVLHCAMGTMYGSQDKNTNHS